MLVRLYNLYTSHGGSGGCEMVCALFYRFRFIQHMYFPDSSKIVIVIMYELRFSL